MSCIFLRIGILCIILLIEVPCTCIPNNTAVAESCVGEHLEWPALIE